jgi:hypothetical protein
MERVKNNLQGKVPRYFGHETGLRMTPYCRPVQNACHPEERSEEGSGFACRPEQREGPGFAFKKPSAQILQACGLQNDTLNPPQILRAVNLPSG